MRHARFHSRASAASPAGGAGQLWKLFRKLNATQSHGCAPSLLNDKIDEFF
jgi:hypothetical protein